MTQLPVRRSLTAAALVAALAVACGREAAPPVEAHAGHAQPVAASAAPSSATPAAVATLASTLPAAVPAAAAHDANAAFAGTREETARFISYYQGIRLTPAQERVKVEALSAIAAPCCADNPLATCCCPCNMAKAAWGLSAWLITEKGYGVEQVRQAAKDWLAAANPDGFSGDACYEGGCTRAIHENGCGGMNDRQVL